MKRISYIGKLKMGLGILTGLLGFIFVILLFNLHALHSEKSKIYYILYFIVFGITIVIMGKIFSLIRKQEEYYRNLCERFVQGEVYQDFIDNIGGLYKYLPDAIGRLDELLDRQNVIQLSTKQAEFLALQNQINPHFLYNTLEAIRGDALCAGLENIADITEALSTFFRYTITETRNLVTLQDELDNVDNYFKIQQYRFGDKMNMEVKVKGNENQLLQMQCPKLMLQPIIENAIFHGLERRIEDGKLCVLIEQVEEDIMISVSDNGVGIDEQLLAKLNSSLSRVSVGYIKEDQSQKKGGIALKNVCRRIKLLFGEKYGVHIHSILGIGTKVVITLPVIQSDKLG